MLLVEILKLQFLRQSIVCYWSIIAPVSQLMAAWNTLSTFLTTLIFAESREETNCLWPAAREDRGGTRTTIPTIRAASEMWFVGCDRDGSLLFQNNINKIIGILNLLPAFCLFSFC